MLQEAKGVECPVCGAIHPVSFDGRRGYGFYCTSKECVKWYPAEVPECHDDGNDAGDYRMGN